MDAIAVLILFGRCYAKVLDSDVNAIKTWLQYRYGMPKQIIEQTNVNPITEIVLIDPNSNT
jgi:hypothetical protein